MIKEITKEHLVESTWYKVQYIIDLNGNPIKTDYHPKAGLFNGHRDVLINGVLIFTGFLANLGFKPYILNTKTYTFSDLKKEEGTFAMINDLKSTIEISSGTFKFFYNNCLMYDISSRRFDDDQLYIKIGS
jgi:hypothetical protein